MKCAICLRGAISKVNNRFIYPGTLYNSSPYVNYKAVHNSIKTHIINANPTIHFDFFIQSWNVDLKDELIELYKPIATSFEDNNKYKDEIEHSLMMTNRPIHEFGGTSQLLAFDKSIQLLKNYVEESKTNYDYVLLYRPDVMLWKDMDFSNYDIHNIYVNAHPNSGGDFHFVMNLMNAFEFRKIYETTKYNNVVTHTYLHGKIKMYVEQFMKQKLFMDNIVPGKDQEVLRKIKKMTIDLHNVDINIFYKYGLTYEQILTYTLE
jgi:hypothetical protein